MYEGRKKPTIEDLLASVPEGCVEWHFYKNLYAIVAPMPLKKSEELGLAILKYFDEANDIILQGGKPLVGCEAIGLECIADVIAVVLPHISPDPIWWKAGRGWDYNPKVDRLMPKLKEAFLASPLVERLEEWN